MAPSYGETRRGQRYATKRERSDVRLTNEVYLVGGGISNAFGLSNDPDCHVYLVDGGDEWR